MKRYQKLMTGFVIVMMLLQCMFSGAMPVFALGSFTGTVSGLTGGNLFYNAGTFTVNFSEAVSPSTVTNANVSIVDSLGRNIKGVIVLNLSNNNQTLAINFGQLDLNAAYTLKLTSAILNQDGSKALTAIDQGFTASNPNADRMLNYDYQGAAVGNLSGADNTNWSVSGISFDNSGDANLGYASIQQEGANKYLHLTAPDSGSPVQIVKFNGSKTSLSSTIATSVVMEYDIRASNDDCDRRIAYLVGIYSDGINAATDPYYQQIGLVNNQGGNSKLSTYAKLSGTSYYGNTNMDPNQWYSVRVVVQKDPNGIYYQNLYNKDAAGNWISVIKDYHNDTNSPGKYFTNIGDYKPIVLRKVGTSRPWADFDNLRMTRDIGNLTVLKSSIANGAANVSKSTGSITVSFNDDLDALQENINNIKLTSPTGEISTTKTYDGQSRTVTIDVPANELKNSTSYTIDLSKVQSAHGRNSTANISFTTEASIWPELEVVDSSIKNNATNVSVNTGNITISYNDEVDPTTMSIVKLKSNDGEITTTNTLEDNKKIKLSLQTNLKYGKAYTIDASQLLSTHGSAVKAGQEKINFTTEASPLGDILLVTSSIANGATGIDVVPGNIMLTFNSDLEATSIDNLKLKSADNTEIAITKTYDPQGKKITIEVKDILNPMTVYTIDLSNVQSKYGLKNAANIIFTTADSPYFKGTVAKVNGSILAGSSALPSFNVTFDEAVDPSTITSSNISIIDSHGNNVPGGMFFDLSPNKKTIAIRVGKLELGSAYTLSLNSNITNASGTKSLALISEKFDTAAPDLYNENYEKYAIGVVSPLDRGTTALAADEPNDNSRISIRQDSNGKYVHTTAPSVLNKFIFINKSAPSGQTYYLTENFAIEANIRVSNDSFSRVLGLIYGPEQVQGSTKWIQTVAVNIANSNSTTTENGAAKNVYSNMDPNKFYSFKVFYIKDANGYYSYSVYKKDDNGKWSPVVLKAYNYTDMSKVPRDVIAMKILAMVGNGTQSETAFTDFDNVKMYKLSNDLSVLNSSIANNASDVSVTPGNVSITFNDDIDTSTVNMCKIMGNVGDPNSTVLAKNAYDPSNRTLTITPLQRLDNNTGYTIDLSKMKNYLGMSGCANISFTTAQLDLQLSGNIAFKTQDGKTVTSLNNCTSLYVDTTIKNNVDTSLPAVIVIEVYDDKGRMVAVNMKEKTIQAKSAGTLINDVGVMNISPQVGWKAYAYVWNGPINSAKPLAKNGYIQYWN